MTEFPQRLVLLLMFKEKRI